jgi:uncharacterized membrane protein
MLDAVVNAIRDFFLVRVGEEWCVFFCSMIPVIELRGAIPMGAVFGMPWWLTYILSVLGNMVPVPFILLMIKAVIGFMSRSKAKLFNKVADFLLRRVEKRRGFIERFSFFGVCFFVGVPLPMTGAWTGSLVAAMIDMKLWKALLSCLLGVMISGTVMTLISYGTAAIFS